MKHLPNLLTIFRIVLTPVFLLLAVYGGTQPALVWAWIVFVTAALTDWLDGKLARKYNVISNFGKIWDPLADKFIVLAALGVLTWASPFKLSWLVFAIIALREVLVTIMREVNARRHIIIPADKWGKLKTVLQMVGIVICLGAWALDFLHPAILAGGKLWFWLVAVVTVFSGANYFKAVRKDA